MQKSGGTQSKKGVALVELLVVLAIFFSLLTMGVINLINSQKRQNLDGTVNVLIADIASQKNKAMLGDTSGTGSVLSYGVYFEPGRYVLFHGSSYSTTDPDNFEVRLDEGIQFSNILFPSAQIVFQPITAEVDGLIDGFDSVTIKDVQGGQTRTIQFNIYGAVTQLN